MYRGFTVFDLPWSNDPRSHPRVTQQALKRTLQSGDTKAGDAAYKQRPMLFRGATNRQIVAGLQIYQLPLISYLLTHSMEQSPSWEANWFSTSQEIPRVLWNPKVPHRTHKRPPPIPFLSQPISISNCPSVSSCNNIFHCTEYEKVKFNKQRHYNGMSLLTRDQAK
jgi:hypothetical protein